MSSYLENLQNSNIKIMVTGAGGFIGNSLCETLNCYGFEVISAVRASKNLALNEMVIGEIDLHTNWKYLLNQVDVVIHLAARVHVMHDNNRDSVSLYRDINVNATENLARQSALAGVKRFVFVSSIKVNGELTNAEPFNESHIPEPQDPYGISKWEAEEMLRRIGNETGMEIVIVRPPLVYGPGVKANFYNLLKLADKSVPMPFGSINNSRSMIYLGNLVDALIQCATHPKAANQAYLVSDGKDVSTPELVDMIANAMKKPSRVFRFPIPLMRLAAALIGKTSMVDRLTQSLVIDSSKIRNNLTWTPPYTMSQGIQETADWYLHSKHSHHD